MNILVLTGSPHASGTTAGLADAFIAGAKDAGHKISRFDAAKLNVNPCSGCFYCTKHDGKCTLDDGMQFIYPHLVAADAVVLVTPLYYYGMSAQIKRVIDRFFSVNGKLMEKPKKLVLLSACSDKEEWAMDALTAHIKSLCRYLGWQEAGAVLGFGANSAEEAQSLGYAAAARDLGKSL